MSKLALCRVSDTEPLRSLLEMLESAGYECVLPNRRLRDTLRDMGCRNVDEFKDMCSRWGAEMPPDRLCEIGPEEVKGVDLYVDVNGNYNGLKVLDKWPNLKGKILTYFINGGEPRLTWDKGDCQTPTFPMVTTAQHYRSTLFCPTKHPNVEAFSCDDPPNPRGYWTNTSLSHPQPIYNDHGSLVDHWLCPWGCGPLTKAPWLGKVYVFYPSFTHWNEVVPRSDGSKGYSNPVSFVHNCMSWGCQAYVKPAMELGVKAYGGGNSPSGLVHHSRVWGVLANALCTVYLKGGGAVDYSILEPMATGCPVTFHDSYVHNTRLYDLLVPGLTCLTWSDEHEMHEVIERLKDPGENRYIGENGRERLKKVLWNQHNKQDVESFKEWMSRMFQ